TVWLEYRHAIAEPPDLRPPVWTGHVILGSSDTVAAARFYEQIGMRPVQVAEHFSVLEMRGGTHLAIRYAPRARRGWSVSMGSHGRRRRRHARQVAGCGASRERDKERPSAPRLGVDGPRRPCPHGPRQPRHRSGLDPDLLSAVDQVVDLPAALSTVDDDSK